MLVHYIMCIIVDLSLNIKLLYVIFHQLYIFVHLKHTVQRALYRRQNETPTNLQQKLFRFSHKL